MLGIENVLAVEYENILMGKQKFFSTEKQTRNKIYYVPLMRYVFEQMLQWDRKTVRNRLSMDVLRAVKLDRLIPRLDIPGEVDLEEDCYYLVHLMYPDDYPYSTEQAILKHYEDVLTHQKRRIRKNLFRDESGKQAARICLAYAVRNYLPVVRTEHLYYFFADNAVANDFLKRYKLKDACDAHYESALDFLHDALRYPQKNDLYYTYYKYKKEFEIRREEYK